jgi:hypothetical protein
VIVAGPVIDTIWAFKRRMQNFEALIIMREIWVIEGRKRYDSIQMFEVVYWG